MLMISILFSQDGYFKQLSGVMKFKEFLIDINSNSLIKCIFTNQYRLNLILNFICYDDERVYNELVEQIYPEFYKFENSLFNIIDIDNQKKVMEIIYKLICSNRQKLSFILDNELLEQIKSEFKEEFPLNYKENY